jgi:hypothetical protein
MLPRLAMALLEFIGVGGIVGLVAFVSWTKLSLGAVLALLGAFFPNMDTGMGKRDPDGGSAQLKMWNVLLKLSGGLRFGVVIAGLVVLVGAVLDAHEGYIEHYTQTPSSSYLSSSEATQLRKALDQETLKKILDSANSVNFSPEFKRNVRTLLRDPAKESVKDTDH